MLFAEYNFFKINFIEPASPLMYGIVELHDHIFFFLNMILFLVLFLIFSTLRLFTYKKNTKVNRYLLWQTASPRFEWIRLNSGTAIEVIWTVIPSLILVLIAIPSFALLYATDELVDPSLTIQVVAHQWYWSYEYNDLVVVKKVMTMNIDIARKVEKFLKPLSILLGYDLNITTDKESFIWFLAKENTVSTLIGVKPWVWNSYARSFVDSLLLKTIYVDLFSFYKLFDNTFNNFAHSAEFGLVVGLGFKSKKYVGNIEFDSYLKQEDDLQLGEPRLYETDFPLVLPKFTHIRYMITSDDVIHSWSVPALGIKVDAVPGRINHAHTYIKRSGVFYGQCSELCGVNHAFMPIQLVVFEPHMYYDYIRLSLLNK